MGPSGIQDGSVQHADMHQYGNHRLLNPSIDFTVSSSYDPYDIFSDNVTARPPYPRFSQEETFSNTFTEPKTFQGMAHHGAAHADSCLDSCSGTQYRSSTPKGTLANTALRNKFMPANMENSYAGQNIFQYDLLGPTMDYNDHGIFGANDDKQHENRSWTETYGQYVPQMSQTGINRTGEQILQNQDHQWEACSVTTCDSRCELSDPCTGEACANEVDACTDRTCPEKNDVDISDLSKNKLPAEIVNAAAALANIGGMPDFQDHSYSLPQQSELFAPTMYNALFTRLCMTDSSCLSDNETSAVRTLTSEQHYLRLHPRITFLRGSSGHYSPPWQTLVNTYYGLIVILTLPTVQGLALLTILWSTATVTFRTQ